MTFPEVHLAGEAVAAFVDGELAPVAYARALAHLDVCTECRDAVRAQQEAVALLAGAADPVPPAALMARLRDIPMTTDLGGSDVVLAIAGDDLVWATSSSLRGRPYDRFASDATRPGPGQPGTARRVRAASARPPQHQTNDRRPLSAQTQAPPGRPWRMRRVLVGAVAGIAFGVFAATAPTTTSGAGVFPNRDLIRGGNGGIVDPPAFGEITGVRDIGGTGLDTGEFGVIRFADSGVNAANRMGDMSGSRGARRALWGDVLGGVGTRPSVDAAARGVGMR